MTSLSVAISGTRRDFDMKIDNTNPEMTYYCPHCEDFYPIKHLMISQDASVIVEITYSGGRWHTTPPKIEDVSLHDEINYYCGECSEEVDEPDAPHDFWMYFDERPDGWKDPDEYAAMMLRPVVADIT